MLFLRRGMSLKSMVNSQILTSLCSFSSKASEVVDNTDEAIGSSSIITSQNISANSDVRLHLSPLFSRGGGGSRSDDYNIEVVDHETWCVSSGLAEAWKGRENALEVKDWVEEAVDEVGSYVPANKEDPNFDEIEDMRIRGNLFYKLDKDSKEFEEYSFDFHRRNSSKNEDYRKKKKNKKQENSNPKKVEKSSLRKDEQRGSKSNENSSSISREYVKCDILNSSISEEADSCFDGKKVRTLTFNQLTAPYHEPFCLDIFISNASVRACIIHRATSKVVAVAHSISKDMKFDLNSTRNTAACAAVGGILAQRALADDIHNVVYTPRKGDKLEGKLQIVLRSIIENGVNVKVKLKQKRFKKSGPLFNA